MIIIYIFVSRALKSPRKLKMIPNAKNAVLVRRESRKLSVPNYN